ncbi:MAG TPA: NAD-dependent epimerase/dehydratase family protein [Steroidobacteraceae bacterium]|jgi:UDP-glucose 4-epimerase|nr:NAD-dependent epimerase/dehydratase family protein [Steroidobacteraceae bacterium]
MSKYLVTGGCGFIGSAVVNCLLERGEQVVIVDNMSVGKDRWVDASRKPTLLKEDIRNPEACARILRDTKPETVLHLAAHHFIPLCEDNAYAAYELNVYGTLNVLEQARVNGVRNFFLASSGDVYPPNFVPHREVDAVSPVYIYGHTKMMAEQMCMRYFESKTCFRTLLIGRLFNAAGPRETNPHLLAEVTKQVARDGKKLIEVGNLWPLRDYVDVDSMASAILDATAKVEGLEILNFGSGKAVEVKEALRILTSVLPFGIQIKSVPERQRPNDRPFLCPDTTRLRRAIGRSADSFNEQTARKIFAEYPGLLTG